MDVIIFGELEVVVDGVSVPVRGAKQRALLALLALQRGRPVSAERLIDELWDEGEVANPANALQAQIGQLRRTLGAATVVTSEAGYALAIGPDDLDAARFEQLVAEGRRLSGQGEMALASVTLADALRLSRGEPLAEFAYSNVADAERRHLGELMLVATETRVEVDLGLGRHGELVGELEMLCRKTLFVSACGSCSCSPSTGPGARPKRFGPTAKSVTAWSKSSESIPAPPFAM